jgi:DNA polymerase-4
MHPAILHADVDAFYASVAQRDDPSLRGRPVVVGSWVVMAASYEARASGVRSGMPTSRARRLCPGLVEASPGWDAFAAASKTVFAIFDRYTRLVEPGSMEEAFLDVSEAGEPPRSLAERLRRDVREEAGLPLSVGVARTKVLATIASREAKPDGLYVVDPARELEFLHALPVERIWGVGPATARKLHAFGLMKVRDAAALEEADLVAILGRSAGRYVHAIAHNREYRRVRRRRGRRSFGAQRALGRSPRSREDVEAAVRDLADRLARRMEKKRRAGRTVVLRLRFGDYTRASRSHTLTAPTGDATTIAAAGLALLAAAMPIVERRGITLVGLTVTNLIGEEGGEQLVLDALDDSVAADPPADPPAGDPPAADPPADPPGGDPPAADPRAADPPPEPPAADPPPG